MLATSARMKTQLTQAELQEAERRLKAQLGSAAELLEDLEQGTLEPTGDPDGQPSDEGEDDAAVARDAGAIEVEDTLLYEVREALERIADGTYGICEVCDRPIERERLAVVTYARACGACALREDAGG
jgi:DnaK suppressor protein